MRRSEHGPPLLRAAVLSLLGMLLLAACENLVPTSPKEEAPQPREPAVVTSMARIRYNAPIIDDLPPTHLPRGGTYVVRITGQHLRGVRTIRFSNDTVVTGTIISRSDTTLSFGVSSTWVRDDFEGEVEIRDVGVTLDGVRAGKLQIVRGPAPVVAIRILNGPAVIPRDKDVSITLQAEVRHAGNVPPLSWTERYSFVSYEEGKSFRIGLRSDSQLVYTREWTVFPYRPELQDSRITVRSYGYTAITGSTVKGKAGIMIPLQNP